MAEEFEIILLRDLSKILNLNGSKIFKCFLRSTFLENLTIGKYFHFDSNDLRLIKNTLQSMILHRKSERDLSRIQDKILDNA